jgi:hypothetical protein
MGNQEGFMGPWRSVLLEDEPAVGWRAWLGLQGRLFLLLGMARQDEDGDARNVGGPCNSRDRALVNGVSIRID